MILCREKQAEALRKQIVQPFLERKTEIDIFFKSIPLKFNDELIRLEKEILEFKSTPFIRLQGKWLTELGFNVGAKFTANINKYLITLKVKHEN